MKRIGVLANCSKPDATSVLQRLQAKASELKLELVADFDTAELLQGCTSVSKDKLADHIDVLVAMGGDGTLLSAVRVLGGAQIPVLGVNLGSLGFMTSVTQEDLERGIDALAKGDFTTSTRAVAECQVLHNGAQSESYRALNDVVVGWGDSPRAVTIGLAIDGEQVTSYICDGIIVSTPTGSTGHSLSAGGPILHPEADVLLVNMICPHSLGARPLVIPGSSALTLEVLESPKSLLMSIDGQDGQEMGLGDRLEIKRSDSSVSFIHLPGYSYFSLLRQKLHWRGSNF